MGSMRSMGYSFESAVADVIDNSISANCKNVILFFPLKTYAFTSSLCKPPCARTCRSLFATRYSHSQPTMPIN